jgi:sarcosine oxidase subunit gamma
MRATAAVELNNAGLSPFDIAINTCSVTNGRISARLGPDEWLLLGDSDGSSLARELHVALAGDNFSLVDIGHRNVAIAVAGGHAREVINGDCPLDLDDEAFPPGSATRTLLGKAEIILLRPGAEASYRLECWRSFAPYVLALLKEVGRELESS